MTALGNLRGKLIFGLLLGLVVVAGLAIYADFSKMLAVLRSFNWWLLPIILLFTLFNYVLRFYKWDVYLRLIGATGVPKKDSALIFISGMAMAMTPGKVGELLPIILLFTLFNYVLRFYKWDVYLRLIGATGVPKKDSALIFVSGMAMAMTPGKVGELLKSYLLKQIRGTPLAASAPIVMAERFTDGLAMLVLASAGLVLFDYGRPVLVGIAIFAVLFLFIFQNRAIFNRLLSLGEKLPVVSKGVHHFHAFYNSSYELFRLPNLLFGVVIGVISWSGEVVAFVLVMMGLGMPFSWTLVIICAFTLSASTLIGSVTLLPGGLGTADASITGMLLFLVPAYITGFVMTQDIAVAATLLIRFSTLWFGVGLGLIALTFMQRRLGSLEKIASDDAEPGAAREALARSES